MKTEVEALLKEAKEAVGKEDFDHMKNLYDKLTALSHKMAEEMYKGAQGAGGAPGGPGGGAQGGTPGGDGEKKEDDRSRPITEKKSTRLGWQAPLGCLPRGECNVQPNHFTRAGARDSRLAR